MNTVGAGAAPRRLHVAQSRPHRGVRCTVAVIFYERSPECKLRAHSRWLSGRTRWGPHGITKSCRLGIGTGPREHTIKGHTHTHIPPHHPYTLLLASLNHGEVSLVCARRRFYPSGISQTTSVALAATIPPGSACVPGLPTPMLHYSRCCLLS